MQYHQAVSLTRSVHADHYVPGELAEPKGCMSSREILWS